MFQSGEKLTGYKEAKTNFGGGFRNFDVYAGCDVSSSWFFHSRKWEEVFEVVYLLINLDIKACSNLNTYMTCAQIYQKVT